MDPIICDGELQSQQISDPTKTYLRTPFYKTIPQIKTSGPTIGPQYNYSDYDKFCLERNLEPIFSSLNLTFELSSFKLDNAMVLCVVPKVKGTLFEMSEKTQYKLQEEVNYVCSNLYHLCLLYDISTDDIYPKTWLYNIFSKLQISTTLNPSFINGRLYLSLNEFDNYSDLYSNAFDALMIQISQLYNSGTLVCDIDFAKKWNLVPYKNKIFIANWIDSRVTMDKSLFLANIFINPVITLSIPHNYLLYHKLAKLIELPIIDEGILQFKVDNLSQIQDLLSIIASNMFEENYSLSLIPISSKGIFELYNSKILQKYNADISLYKNSDCRNPYMLSVYVKGILNLQEDLNRYLDLI